MADEETAMTMDDATIRFWDKAAPKYARSPIKDMVGYERTLERTIALIAGAANVLEIGCGTGTTALKIAPHVGRIVASDIAPGMIAIARDKMAQAGVANVAFTADPADAAQGEDQTFDAVLAFNLLHLTGARAAVFEQARRHLKPGGLFISKTACLSEMNPVIRLAVPAMRAVGLAPEVAVFDAAGLEREIATAGFTVIERARHGSGRKDPRIFLVARRPG